MHHPQAKSFIGPKSSKKPQENMLNNMFEINSQEKEQGFTITQTKSISQGLLW